MESSLQIAGFWERFAHWNKLFSKTGSTEFRLTCYCDPGLWHVKRAGLEIPFKDLFPKSTWPRRFFNTLAVISQLKPLEAEHVTHERQNGLISLELSRDLWNMTQRDNFFFFSGNVIL